MSENQHISRAAARMIERYGDDALNQVDGRIEELNETGNDSGEADKLWRQVREVVERMLEDPHGNFPH